MAKAARHVCLIAILAFLQLRSAHAADDSNLEIAFAPFLPVSTLVKNYAPLTQHLKQALHRPVTIVSATDYRTFHKQIKQYEFPVIVTIANSAYLAWADFGYIPLLQPITQTRPVILLPPGHTLSSPANLHGKKISMADRTSVVSEYAIELLKADGLDPDKDISITYMGDHKSAVNMLIAGEVDAAIVSDRAILQLPATLQEQFSVAYTWDNPFPGIVYMGNPHTDKAELQRIKEAILQFSTNTADGIKMMQKFGYEGLKTINASDMKTLQPIGLKLKLELEK